MEGEHEHRVTIERQAFERNSDRRELIPSQVKSIFRNERDVVPEGFGWVRIRRFWGGVFFSKGGTTLQRDAEVESF